MEEKSPVRHLYEKWQDEACNIHATNEDVLTTMSLILFDFVVDEGQSLEVLLDDIKEHVEYYLKLMNNASSKS